MNQISLSCSIVLFRPEAEIFQQTVKSLIAAGDRLHRAGIIRILLVNNAPHATKDTTVHLLGETDTGRRAIDVEFISGHGNIGYGRAHNLAIEKCGCDYHLILNPDVLLAEDALMRAIEFMESSPECGLLAPKVFDGQGAVQYLCKRYPTVLDLILRGFMPSPVHKVFRKRLDRYEMRDVIGDKLVWDVPIVSGCFMLFRRSVLEKLKGFSSEYFLYFEDFDLSLRTGQIARIAYVPSVRIVHFGGQAAKKGWRHIGMFTRSAITFFNRHGWKLW